MTSSDRVITRCSNIGYVSARDRSSAHRWRNRARGCSRTKTLVRRAGQQRSVRDPDQEGDKNAVDQRGRTQSESGGRDARDQCWNGSHDEHGGYQACLCTGRRKGNRHTEGTWKGKTKAHAGNGSPAEEGRGCCRRDAAKRQDRPSKQEQAADQHRRSGTDAAEGNCHNELRSRTEGRSPDLPTPDLMNQLPQRPMTARARGRDHRVPRRRPDTEWLRRKLSARGAER